VKTKWPENTRSAKGYEVCDLIEWHEQRYQAAIERLKVAVEALQKIVHEEFGESAVETADNALLKIDMPEEP
jgi:hypothetical protein